MSACEVCGDEISAERLEAVPGVTYCIPCQVRAEKIQERIERERWREEERTFGRRLCAGFDLLSQTASDACDVIHDARLDRDV